jgi:hypothetical protein
MSQTLMTVTLAVTLLVIGFIASWGAPFYVVVIMFIGWAMLLGYVLREEKRGG